MTVKQLIEHLQTLDPELYVFKPGYEGGLENMNVNVNSKVIHVELDRNKEWWYGPHAEILSPELSPNAVKGIVL
jgi:hypothetical protein